MRFERKAPSDHLTSHERLGDHDRWVVEVIYGAATNSFAEVDPASNPRAPALRFLPSVIASGWKPVVGLERPHGAGVLEKSTRRSPIPG